MSGNKMKSRRARALIFDLDGTLVDSGLDIAISANFTRTHFGLPEVSTETALGFVGDGVVKLLQRCLTIDDAAPSGDMVAEGLQVFRDHYGRHCLDHTHPYPGVLATLVHFNRLPLMIATNKPRVFTMQILKGLHLDGAFSRIVAGDDCENRKPAPDQLLKCLEGTGILPQDAAMIGDHANDINAAKACGAISVGVTWGLSRPGLVQSADPDYIIDEFSRLKDCFPSRETL